MQNNWQFHSQCFKNSNTNTNGYQLVTGWISNKNSEINKSPLIVINKFLVDLKSTNRKFERKLEPFRQIAANRIIYLLNFCHSHKHVWNLSYERQDSLKTCLYQQYGNKIKNCSNSYSVSQSVNWFLRYLRCQFLHY